MGIACFFLAFPAFAQKHYSEITFPDLPDFDVPEAERVELKNGMIVFLIEDHELPMVNISARIAGGGLYDDADKVGTARVAGTVMRTGGTTSISGDELNERLENIAASIETFAGSSSASASMFTLKEHTSEVLSLYADVLMNPAFPEDKIELAKTQQKSNISRRNDDAQQIAFREFNELLYGSDSPYARSTEYATIDAITKEDLQAFHQQFYHPNNTILGVWGDFETSQMVQQIEMAFKDWPMAKDFQKPETPSFETASDYGVFFAPKTDVTQSVVLLGHPGELRIDDPDYYAVTVMNQILSGGFSSRLFQNVRDDQGLAYAVFGRYTANYDRPGQFYAGVMTKSESTVQAANSVLHEIEKMRETPPTDEEMTQAKDAYLNSFVFNFDTRREIVSRMMTYEFYGYPKDLLEKQNSGINAVSKEDVMDVSQKYLKPDDVKIMVVGNDADFGTPLSELGEVTEVDITIPTGEEPPPEATDETLMAGRKLLEETAEAMGGLDAFGAMESIYAVLKQDLTTPDNQVISVEITTVSVYPDKFMLKQKAPMGEFSMLKNGDSIQIVSAQGKMDAPPPVRSLINQSIWRDFSRLFKNLDEEGLSIQHLGLQSLNELEVEAVLINTPAGSSYTLLIDKATKLPAGMTYQAPSPTGGIATSTETYSDFREVDGFMIPFKTVSMVEGQGESVTNMESVTINGDVDMSVFE